MVLYGKNESYKLFRVESSLSSIKIFVFPCDKWCSFVTWEHKTFNPRIHLYLDNTTAIKYISKQGGRKRQLNDLAREKWLWCIDRDIWLTCFHIPGRLNVTADKLSRIKNYDTEWSLDNAAFCRIEDIYGCFDIDLFASSKNHKCAKYASFKPDCRAFAVNAFSLVWSDYFVYIFCPFSILGAVLQKVLQDEAEAVIIAPFFATEPWFPRLLSLVCAQSFILPPVSQILFLQGQKNYHHPLQKMTLGVFGSPAMPREYRNFKGHCLYYPLILAR